MWWSGREAMTKVSQTTLLTAKLPACEHEMATSKSHCPLHRSFWFRSAKGSWRTLGCKVRFKSTLLVSTAATALWTSKTKLMHYSGLPRDIMRWCAERCVARRTEMPWTRPRSHTFFLSSTKRYVSSTLTRLAACGDGLQTTTSVAQTRPF